MLLLLLSRVDADRISPSVKNSIHVGDRILEINGTPIHNIPLDEVFTTLATLFLQTKLKMTFKHFSISSFILPKQRCHHLLLSRPQIDSLIQETSQLLQLTIEHDPHGQGQQGGSSRADAQQDGPLSSPVSGSPSPALPVTQPPNPDISSLRTCIKA